MNPKREIKLTFNIQSTDIEISSNDEFTKDELVCMESLNSNIIGDKICKDTIIKHAYNIRNSITDCRVIVVETKPQIVYSHNEETVIAEV